MFPSVDLRPSCPELTQPRRTGSAKAIWDFEGIYCTSRHIPHVKFAGLIHPGILGCAPSSQVLETWNRREGELIAANTLDRVVALPWVCPGNPSGWLPALTEPSQIGRSL